MATIAGKPTGKIGYGLMGLTWTNTPPTYEESFKLLKTALAQGANLWNAGEFYGPPDANSLQLLKAYFTKYPEDAAKVVLSVKGAVEPDHSFAGDETRVRASVENCLRLLDGTKDIDIFECARVDKSTPIEETMQALEKLRQEGKIGGIGLSEVRAETIRRAAKVATISTVEIELSMWATEPLRNGILSACGELGIPVTAYSPLGRGFLTGGIKSVEDLLENDIRRGYPRFQPGAIKANTRLVEGLSVIAEKKGVMLSHLAVAWVVAQGKQFNNVPIVPIPGSTNVERVVENSQLCDLSEEELAAIKAVLEASEVQGGRYPDAFIGFCDG